MAKVKGKVVTEGNAVFFNVTEVNGVATDGGRWQIVHDQYNYARALGADQEYTAYVEAIRPWPDPAVMVGQKGYMRIIEFVKPSMKELPINAISSLAHPPGQIHVSPGSTATPSTPAPTASAAR